MATKIGFFLKQSEFGRGDQDLNFTGIYEDTHDNKLKVTLKRDSVDFQSYGRIEIYSPAEKKWNFLDHIHYSQLAIMKDSYYARDENGNVRGRLTFWETDANRLLEKAAVILD